MEDALSLVAREDAVGQLGGLRARQRGSHQALELTACGELGDDPLEHAVPDDRAGDVLRERARQRPVDDAGDLRRGHDLVRSLFQLPAPSAGSFPRREERGACGCVGQPGAVLVVVRCHRYKVSPTPRNWSGTR